MIRYKKKVKKISINYSKLLIQILLDLKMKKLNQIITFLDYINLIEIIF